MDGNDVALEPLYGSYGAEVHGCARMISGAAVADVVTARVLQAAVRHDRGPDADTRLQLVVRAHRMAIETGRRRRSVLSDDQCDAVALVTCGRCTCRQAAVIMGVSVGDVQRHLDEAARALDWPRHVVS